MEVKLKDLLYGASALPFDATLIELMKVSCDEYMRTDVCEKTELLTPAFVYDYINHDFRENICGKLVANGYDVVLTDEVLIRLSEYAVVSSILEEKNPLQKSLAATKVMNLMFAARGRFDTIPNSLIVKLVYPYHLSYYIEGLDKAEPTALSLEMFSKINSKDADSVGVSFDANEVPSVKTVFKESMLYRCERLLRRNDIQNIENPYVRVYIALTRLINELPYLFYNIDVLEIIETLVHETEKTKRKKLANIISDIQASDIKPFVNYSNSSVLLSLVDNKNNNYPHDLGEQMLPIKEYAVYLFYELLTEKIIEE